MTTSRKEKAMSFVAHDKQRQAYTVEWWREILTTTLGATGQTREQTGREWFVTEKGDSVYRTQPKTYFVPALKVELTTVDANAP